MVWVLSEVYTLAYIYVLEEGAFKSPLVENTLWTLQL